MDDSTRVPIEAIHAHPDLTPRTDNVLLGLIEQALDGRLGVYFGAVPVGRVVPFDLDYRPDRHPIGASAIDTSLEEWKLGNFRKLLVYPRGCWFILSDNYISLFAALRGNVEYLPCWILGKPETGLSKDVQGPIALADVPKIFGME